MERNSAVVLLGGLATGAGLMYVLDPQMGRRRRAMARNKAVHILNRSEDTISKTFRDSKNRAHGIVAGVRSRFTQEPVDDDALVGRIRAKLGRVTGHVGM